MYLSSREGGWDGGEWKSYFTKIIFNIFPSSLFLFPSIVARTSRWVSVLSIKILKILGGGNSFLGGGAPPFASPLNTRLVVLYTEVGRYISG